MARGRGLEKKKFLLSHPLLTEFGEFWDFFWDWAYRRAYRWYRYFETGKDGVVDVLYRKRGKYSRPFVHSSMVGLLFLGITVGPVIIKAQEDPLQNTQLLQPMVLGLSTQDAMEMGMRTVSSEGVLTYRGGEIIEHSVKNGETLSTIASQYNLNVDTVLWANDFANEKVTIKEGQPLKIPPVDGVIHKVRKGETVYSIGKKYEANPQAIVDYPFNEFTNDETFDLAIGQVLMVPDGIMPQVQPVSPRTSLAQRLTPDAGVVSAVGSFVWPASGTLSQSYRFYHKAIDIATSHGNPILAADGGTITVSGWPDNSGYGNRVIIDHGNGYSSLYAHMSRVAVVAGQSVNRGDVIGYVGSTGRSTGPHLHFEIRAGGGLQNPLNYLK